MKTEKVPSNPPEKHKEMKLENALRVVSAVPTVPHTNHRYFITCACCLLVLFTVVSHHTQGVKSSGRFIDFVCVGRALIPAKASSQAQHIKMVMVIKEFRAGVIFQGKCFYERSK